MDRNQNLRLDQRIGMRMSLQQLRFVKLLELNAPELDEAVEMAIAENPALEADDFSREEKGIAATADGESFDETSEQMQKADYSRQEEIPHYRLSTPIRSGNEREGEYVISDDGYTLYDYLEAQIAERNLDPDVRTAAEYIVGNLDSNGYLTRSLRQISDDMAINQSLEFSDETMEKAYEVVRSLDPIGVCAVNLQDCLLMQIEALPAGETRDDAAGIIRDHFEAFSMKHMHRIVSGMKISIDRVKKAIDLILSLNPKPGASIGTGIRQVAASIVPDFIVSVDEGEITVHLNNHYPDLRIEESFENAVRRMELNAQGRASRKGQEFISSRYNDARNFIAVLRQRQETLFAVMTAIVKIQKEYFLTEDVHFLRPMMMKDVAALTGYDLSVISRATNNKYVATPWGIFPLRYFFSDSLGKDGEDVTNREIETEIRQLVDSEDKNHPLSDEKIREGLENKGYVLSRRTVAKYRDRLDIPVARLRKNM